MKVILEFDDGRTTVIEADTVGFLVAYWVDRDDLNIQAVTDLELDDKLRMTGVLLDLFADQMKERMLDDEDQLLLDQQKAIRAAESTFEK